MYTRTVSRAYLLTGRPLLEGALIWVFKAVLRLYYGCTKSLLFEALSRLVVAPKALLRLFRGPTLLLDMSRDVWRRPTLYSVGPKDCVGLHILLDVSVCY